MFSFWYVILLGGIVTPGAAQQNTTGPTMEMEEDFIMTPVIQRLMTYGSLNASSVYGEALTEEYVNITEAEHLLQRMVGLTGEQPDSDMLEAINFPKCGGHSEEDESDGPARFATAPNKWKKHDLTYRITLFSRWLDENTVQTIIRDSFKMWAAVTPLTFTEVNATEEADLTVKFQGGEHGDPWPFDGRGGVLAHAFYPTGGQCHFDDDEYWGAANGGGFSLHQTAVHEIGHLLGLRHSTVAAAVMAPYYKFGAQYRVPVLGDDDISGIQSLYGPPNPPTQPPPPEEACTGRIDAAMYNPQIGKNLLFTGEYLWSTDDSSVEVSDIHSTFQFVTSGVNAAIYLPFNENSYLFKGCYVYIYNKNLNFVSRKIISQIFRGLPCSIDSGFYSGADQLTYFFKGMWVYAYQRFSFYGRIRIAGLRWPDIPQELESRINAVYDTSSDQNVVYVIKGDHYYVMDRQSKVFSREQYKVRENLLTPCQ